MSPSSHVVMDSNSTTVPSENVLLDVFDRVDIDGHGALPMERVEEAVREIWPHFDDEESVICRAYNATDLDGDGLIGRHEFGLLLHFLSHYNTMRHYREGTNSDFRISKRRFVTALSQLNVKNTAKAFDDMDVSNQGYLLLDEVCLLMAMRSSRRKSMSKKGTMYRIANSGSSRLLFNDRTIEQRQTRINRVFLDIKSSVELLGLNVSDEQIESWAVLINGCMATSDHRFYSVRRIFDVSDGADPIQVLAACFHQTIRYDFFGLPPEAAKVLDGVIEMKNGDVYCSENDFSDAPHDAMVFDIFGIVPGQKLTYRCGKNKFLCALLAARALKDDFPMPHLTRIVVCIQGTNISHMLELQNSVLRFAHSSQSGEPQASCLAAESPQSDDRSLDQLHFALSKANETYGLDLSETKITEAVERAADFANRSYCMYTMPDIARVLDLLWSWLSQVNPALRSRKLYTVNDYHLGIKMAAKMWGEIEFDKIYTSFHGVPDPAQLCDLIQRANRNRELAIEYTNANSVSLALMAAFAVLSGGNAPMSFFVGDHPTERICSDQLGECLPELTSGDLTGCNMQIYEILAMGRRTNAAFDTGMSLVTAFVYGKLGTDGTRNLLRYTDYPMDEGTAKALLRSLPLDVVVPIGKEIARIAVSRTECFEKLLRCLNTRVAATSA